MESRTPLPPKLSPVPAPGMIDVQVMPSGEVAMAFPTATNWLPVQTTAARLFAADPRGCDVQVTPSGEVSISPSPTATNLFPAQTTEVNPLGVVTTLCGVQV